MPPFKKSHWILFFATAVAISACNTQAATDKSPWLNTSLPIPECVDLLVAQMTLEEKIAQMMHQAPAGGQPGMKIKTNSNILHTSVTIMK